LFFSKSQSGVSCIKIILKGWNSYNLKTRGSVRPRQGRISTLISSFITIWPTSRSVWTSLWSSRNMCNTKIILKGWNSYNLKAWNSVRPRQGRISTLMYSFITIWPTSRSVWTSLWSSRNMCNTKIILKGWNSYKLKALGSVRLWRGRIFTLISSFITIWPTSRSVWISLWIS
jgi:hypothetical protein